MPQSYEAIDLIDPLFRHQINAGSFRNGDREQSHPREMFLDGTVPGDDRAGAGGGSCDGRTGRSFAGC